MTVRTFGVGQDGTLTACRAKPENRGKGNCKHTEHIELTLEDLRSGFIQKHNEEALRELYAQAGITEPGGKLSKKALIEATAPKPKSDYRIETLRKASDAVAEQISDHDFKVIQNFYRRYERVMSEKELAKLSDGDVTPTERLQTYLESDEPVVKDLRKYLGRDASLKDISDLLYLEVGAMTNAYEWSPGSRSSVPRAYLSTLKNDMTKGNYVASVLYFKGKCCYCDRLLSREGGRNGQPSGEHITPVKPEDDNAVVGGTRFGNMALACTRCNGDRGNSELVSWVNSYRHIPKEDKPFVLGRIKAFRAFAEYEDYSQEESDKIRTCIARVQSEVATLREPDGKFPRGGGHSERIREMIAADIVELSDGEVYPVTFAWYD